MLPHARLERGRGEARAGRQAGHGGRASVGGNYSTSKWGYKGALDNLCIIFSAYGWSAGGQEVASRPRPRAISGKFHLAYLSRPNNKKEQHRTLEL